MQKFMYYNKALLSKLKLNKKIKFERETKSYLIVTGTYEDLKGLPYLSWRENEKDRWLSKMTKYEEQPQPFMKFLESQFEGLAHYVDDERRYVIISKLKMPFPSQLIDQVNANGNLALVYDTGDEWKKIAINFKVLATKPANKKKWYLADKSKFKKSWKDDFTTTDVNIDKVVDPRGASDSPYDGFTKLSDKYGYGYRIYPGKPLIPPTKVIHKRKEGY